MSDETMYNDPCPDCGAGLRYVTCLYMGDEEGRGSESLYQCPKCKTIVTK
jgi:predicted RNA-binding Zn-ribbon protein involved in translation (DUF1610 family)